jgi:hypothetical protein
MLPTIIHSLNMAKLHTQMLIFASTQAGSQPQGAFTQKKPKQKDNPNTTEERWALLMRSEASAQTQQHHSAHEREREREREREEDRA